VAALCYLLSENNIVVTKLW